MRIDKKIIEIPKPNNIHNGLTFNIYLFINDIYYKDLDYKSIINEAVNNGNLVEMIKSKWEIVTTPLINKLKFEDIKSRKQVKNTVIIKQQIELQIIDNESNQSNENVNDLKISNIIPNPSDITNTMGCIDDDDDDDHDINEEEEGVTLNITK